MYRLSPKGGAFGFDRCTPLTWEASTWRGRTSVTCDGCCLGLDGFVTIYANASHAFMYVGGLRLDTVEASEFDTGPNSGKPGARWRVFPSVPDWSTRVGRHQVGL